MLARMTHHTTRTRTTIVAAAVTAALAFATPTVTHAAASDASAGSAPHAAASPLGGQKCDAPGAGRRANNGRFVCSPEGGRSVWRRVDGSLSIVDVVEALRGYSTFAYALEQSGIAAELAVGGPYTVFAPRNAAFNALPSGTLDALLRPDNLQALRRILRHHVIRGTYNATQLRTQAYEALDASMLQVRVRTVGGITVDGARVTVADVRAANGVLHGLAEVIIPAGVTINP